MPTGNWNSRNTSVILAQFIEMSFLVNVKDCQKMTGAWPPIVRQFSCGTSEVVDVRKIQPKRMSQPNRAASR